MIILIKGGVVHIGRYCSFGPEVRYFGANHPLNEAVMSPYFYNKSFGLDVEDIERRYLNIGSEVWVGCRVIITEGCRSIGNGAVIGAGTIVTKDVPDYAIFAGNPGKVIRYRFDKNTIELLEESRWWDLKPKELYQFYDKKNKPELFAKAVIEYKKHKTGGLD